MTVLALVGFLLLVVGVPTIIVNQRVIARTLRRRRHRQQELPFLFIPTDDASVPHPVPAWRLSADSAEPGLSVAPEPGIADLPPLPEQDAALPERPSRSMDRPELWDRTAPFEPADEHRIGRDD